MSRSSETIRTGRRETPTRDAPSSRPHASKWRPSARVTAEKLAFKDRHCQDPANAFKFCFDLCSLECPSAAPFERGLHLVRRPEPPPRPRSVPLPGPDLLQLVRSRFRNRTAPLSKAPECLQTNLPCARLATLLLHFPQSTAPSDRASSLRCRT